MKKFVFSLIVVMATFSSVCFGGGADLMESAKKGLIDGSSEVFEKNLGCFEGCIVSDIVFLHEQNFGKDSKEVYVPEGSSFFDVKLVFLVFVLMVLSGFYLKMIGKMFFEKEI